MRPSEHSGLRHQPRNRRVLPDLPGGTGAHRPARPRSDPRRGGRNLRHRPGWHFMAASPIRKRPSKLGSRRYCFPCRTSFPIRGQTSKRSAAKQSPTSMRRSCYTICPSALRSNLVTVETLLEDCPNIAGIKDSSGSLDILRALTRSTSHACRIVGSGGVPESALRESCCDGVISGVAGVLPEVVLSWLLTRQHAAERVA